MSTRIYLLLLAALLAAFPIRSSAQHITHAWANNGEDKVTQHELRAFGGNPVANLVWNGSTIRLFAARNEVVSFNLVLEAPLAAATNVSVELPSLAAPGGHTLHHAPASGAGLFDWTGREIELFYVRYLEIQGLSRWLAPGSYYDERHLPLRWRRAHDPVYGWPDPATCWFDRPLHNQFIPDIAVPLDLHPNFTIAAGTNQSVWVDIYVPPGASNATYTGTVLVKENGVTRFSLPVELFVCNFALPDEPSAKTMMVLSNDNVCFRHTGSGDFTPDCQAATYQYFKMAHRHKISLADGYASDFANSQPYPYWTPILNGSLFTAANGYAGPGAGVGNGVFAIGLYGSWQNWWSGNDTAAVWSHTNNWQSWFNANSPLTDRFLYLVDESPNYAQTNTWASIVAANPGAGGSLKTFATLPIVHADSVPDLSIVCSAQTIGDSAVINPVWNELVNDPDRHLYYYNGGRPGTGSLVTDDDGTAMRVISWTHFKKKVERWFVWESTYFFNYQGTGLENDLFHEAQTFGGCCVFDSCGIYAEGETSAAGQYNYANGDGVFFYPGTDLEFPGDSYGIPGPISSLRLKHWRRGIQDVDYLTLAAAVDSAATQAIVQQIVPKVLWEYGVDFPGDPTYVHTEISWSDNPDTWEAARMALAEIIGGCTIPWAPACDDGIQNGLETGPDCGGVCPPCPPAPCTATYGTPCWSGDFIEDFSFGSFSNLGTGCANPGTNNLSSYLGTGPSVQVGETYSVTVEAGAQYPQYFGLYVDFNADGDFLDAGEFFNLGQGAAGVPLTVSVTLPTTAPTGMRNLRVRSNYDAPLTAADGCNTQLAYGEIEDYNIYLYCPNHLAINANPIASGNYRADVEITALGSVPGGNEVVFRAGASAQLLAGFEVLLGGVLEILLQGCFP